MPLALAASCATTAPAIPAPAATEAQRWSQDVHWMARALRRWHPDPYAAAGREAFHGEVERAAQLPAAESDLDGVGPDRVLGLLRVVAHIGDTHTRLLTDRAIEDLRLPYAVEVHQDQLWIGAVQPGHEQLDVTQIVGVEGRSMVEVGRRLALLVPYDNEPSLLAGVARHLSLPRSLREVGLIRDLERVRLRLRDRHGVEFDAELSPLPAAQLRTWRSTVPRPPTPQGYRPAELWWWEALPEADALYLQYNQCRDSKDGPKFAEFAAELLARLDAGGASRLVVDLRYNGGGDSRVLRPLTDGLAEREVEVVALIGPHTFSSAMLNAWHLRERAGARLLGEPTGGKPNHFGELRRFSLPNTGLELFTSTKSFELVEGDPTSLQPDALVERTLEDVLAGRDPALEAALGPLE